MPDTISADTSIPASTVAEPEVTEFKFKEPIYRDRMILWIFLAMVGGYALTFDAQALGHAANGTWLQRLADCLFNGGMLTDSIWHGQIWRPFTFAFLHGGMFHIFGNAVNFVLIASMCRTIFARRGWQVIFFTSSYLGGVITNLFDPHLALVGASVGIMGLFGAMVAGELRQRKMDKRKLPAEVLIPLKTLLFLLALQLVLEHLIPNVGHIAHASGLVIGFLLGLFLPMNAGVRLVASRPDLLEVTGVTQTVTFRGKVRGLPVVDAIKYKESEAKPGDWLAVFQDEYGPERLCRVMVQDLIGDAPEPAEITDENSTLVADRFSVPLWDAKHKEKEGDLPDALPDLKTPLWERIVHYGFTLLLWRFLFNSWAPSLLYDKKDLAWLHFLPAPFDGWAIFLGSIAGALIVTYFAAAMIESFLGGALLSFFKGFFGAFKKKGDKPSEPQS